MITARAAAKGQLFPRVIWSWIKATYQHNFVSAQDICYEKQSHRWNKGKDHTGQKSRQGQLKADCPEGLCLTCPQITGGFYQ